ncbi:hypothetical protein [Cellulomonas aerilata]|uniref:Uncharacterized protein n=1 Tax=Cellulomonas aerilata TaxID=515326 RepID=A0A512DAN5_9CELL|nr:hypothetical protein [Cellulomonas aerilata]GEO33528.1 hypothetical protein CAE01nite_12530 [Cellulomonas aerilata]
MTRESSPGPLPLDDITSDLRALVGRLGEQLEGVATVGTEQAADTGVVEGGDVVPLREGAVRVWWMHSAEEIYVGIGDAPGWEVPRSAASVDLLHAVIEEAVAGRVEVGKGRGTTTYRVRTPDGHVREDTHEALRGLLLPMPWKPRLRWESSKPYFAGPSTQ